MGWDYTNATHYTKKGDIDRKAEVDLLYHWSNDKTAVSVVKSCMVGSTYYAAVRVEDKETGEAQIKGKVVLTRLDSKSYFGYKAICETCGPGASQCPASILNLLSPTDDEWALAWRERCRNYIEEKKSPRALKNLPVGAVIRYTMRNGKVAELVKHQPAYQFKRPFWYSRETGTYTPATRIPRDYEVVAV